MADVQDLSIDADAARATLVERETAALVESEAADALRELADEHDRKAADLRARAIALRRYLTEHGVVCPPPRLD